MTWPRDGAFLRAMRTIWVVVVVLLVGCGPAPLPVPTGPERLTLKARIENEYAESLFSLTIHVTGSDGGVTSPTLFTDKRIAGYSSAETDFSAFAGDQVTFDFASMSLGDRNTFPLATKLPAVDDAKPTLEITYDYDLATANFSISYLWKSF